MKKHIPAFLVLLACLPLSINIAPAHPASGIVVDPQGQVFFIYGGHGVFKIDQQGKMSCVHRSRGGHWMCLDSAGVFSRTQPRFFERITPDGAKPAIIFADGGAPPMVNADGYLYYGANPEEGGGMPPGGLTVCRMSTDGKLTEFAPRLRTILAESRQGVMGLAEGPGGTIYVDSLSGIYKVKPDGTVTTFVSSVVVADCDADPADHNPDMALPCLRGLAVTAQGTVYAAGTSCHRVLKISPDGHVEIVLKSERPWSPTGVALHGDDVYVLEYTGANGGPDEGWLPRVRKISRAGKVTTLVTITSETGDLPEK
jgi:sugar lactone lactonase YvrE